MKKILIVFVTMLMLTGSYEAKSQINSSISFNTFYNELSPYGRWVNYPEYGQVWISNENGFEPYSTNGRWEFTNYGWMWVSNYNWGWAPFHYGRWAYLNSYGWAWVPGYEWAPAWVGWCNYDGYYGWAPLSPGLGFNYSFSSIPVNYWRFVRPQYINDPYVYRHYQRPVRNTNQYSNVTVINNTVVNNNVTYVAGPAQQDIERITKKKIDPKQVAFNNADNGDKKTVVLNNKKEISVFRPVEKENSAATQNTIQPKQQQNIKTPAVENNKQTQIPQTAVQQKQELIKQKQAALNDAAVDDNNRRQQLPQTPVVKDQQAQQNQDALKQQQIIRRQQQDDANQQLIIRKQQEAIRIQEQNEARQQELTRRQQEQTRQQTEAVKQQEAIRVQQRNEARQQEIIRRQQQQNEIRQQKIQQPQRNQQQWNNQPSIQKGPAPAPQRMVKPTRKS